MGKIVIIQIHILFLIFITIKYTHSLHSSLTHELSLSKPLFVFSSSFLCSSSSGEIHVGGGGDERDLKRQAAGRGRLVRMRAHLRDERACCRAS